MCIHRRTHRGTQWLPLRSSPSKGAGRVGQAVGTVPGQSPIAQCQDHTGSQRSGTRLSESLAIRLCGPRAYNIFREVGFLPSSSASDSSWSWWVPTPRGPQPRSSASPGGLCRSTEAITSDPTQGAQPIRYHICLHDPSHTPRTFGPQGLCTGCPVFLDSPSPTFNTSPVSFSCSRVQPRWTPSTRIFLERLKWAPSLRGSFYIHPFCSEGWPCKSLCWPCLAVSELAWWVVNKHGNPVLQPSI